MMRLGLWYSSSGGDESDQEMGRISPLVVALLIALVAISPTVTGYIASSMTWPGHDAGLASKELTWNHSSPRIRQGSTALDQEEFTFVVTSDMREYAGQGQYDTQQYFRGACEAIASIGESAFMVSPGDIDPPADVKWTIEQYLAPTYLWYPVAGNHETETVADMDWLRAYDYDPNGPAPPNIVNVGPTSCAETTYSFDYGNSHFVVLNEYCDETDDASTDGDVVDAVYDWLAADLSVTDKTNIFVFGHEPAYPQPDAHNGRLRHHGDSLDGHPANRDRFWNLLRNKAVVAYICGHTHNYSAVVIDGVWQLDAGHARGKGDTGARSTFILIHVESDVVTLETYRDDASGGAYTLAHSGALTWERFWLPVILKRARSGSS